MTAALPEYDPEELKRRYGPQLDAAVAPLTPPPPPAAAAPPASLAPPPDGPPAAAPPAQGFATGPWPVRGDVTPPPGSPAAGEELPPAPPPRRGAIDPGLASFLQRGKAAPVASAQEPQGEPINVRRKIFEGIDAIASGLSQHRSGRAFNPSYWQSLDDRDREAALRQRATLEADPASEPSAAARRSMAPALKSMGLTDAEIGTMSAADIKALGKGGNLVMGLVGARQKAATELAKQKQKADETAAANAEWDRRNAVTAPQALQRAETMAGVGAQNAANQAALTNGLAMNRELTMNAVTDRQRQEAEQRAEERRIADEKRKAEMAKEKTEESFVSPDEIEASNTHVSVPNADLLHRTQATSKRQVGDIRNDIKTTERAGHLFDQMVEDEATWSNGSASAKAEVRANQTAGTPLVSDEARKLATVKARYDSFATELQGVKAKIAQSAGSAAEREEGKHEIPAITAFGAHEKLVGIGGMLESNSNANLGSFGGKAHIVTKRPAKAKAAPAPAAPTPSGMVSVRNPQTGTVKHVPAANKDAAVARGWVVVGG